MPNYILWCIKNESYILLVVCAYRPSFSLKWGGHHRRFKLSVQQIACHTYHMSSFFWGLFFFIFFLHSENESFQASSAKWPPLLLLKRIKVKNHFKKRLPYRWRPKGQAAMEFLHSAAVVYKPATRKITFNVRFIE